MVSASPMHAPLNLALYLVTDPEMTARRGLLETVASAIAGGVTIVQLRHKDGPARPRVEAGRALKALLARHGVPLIVNDRVDVAQAIGADGSSCRPGRFAASRCPRLARSGRNRGILHHR